MAEDSTFRTSTVHDTKPCIVGAVLALNTPFLIPDLLCFLTSYPIEMMQLKQKSNDNSEEASESMSENMHHARVIPSILQEGYSLKGGSSLRQVIPS